MMECAVILMAKRPQAGKTKTRLCPPFTPQAAALLYEALLKDSVALAHEMERVQVAVAISPPQSEEYFQRITPPGTLLIPVEGENIGVCLDRSLTALFRMGFHKVMALNTDGPSLPPQYLVDAARLLDECDVVFGPGEDGGYYLVGMKQPCPALFEGIPWSSSGVLASTLAKAEQLRLRTALTPLWYDVDTPADILRLQAEVQQLPANRLLHTRQFFIQQWTETRQE